jgi:hypothetical protein
MESPKEKNAKPEEIEANQAVFVKNFNRIIEQPKEVEGRLEGAGEGDVRRKKALNFMNEDLILREALLKDQDIAEIKKVENKYFTMVYGDKFAKHNHLSFGFLEKIFNAQTQMGNLFLRAVRDPKIRGTLFANIIFNMEINVTSQVLRKGSVFKFLFEVRLSLI